MTTYLESQTSDLESVIEKVNEIISIINKIQNSCTHEFLKGDEKPVHLYPPMCTKCGMELK